MFQTLRECLKYFASSPNVSPAGFRLLSTFVKGKHTARAQFN